MLLEGDQKKKETIRVDCLPLKPDKWCAGEAVVKRLTTTKLKVLSCVTFALTVLNFLCLNRVVE